MSRDLLVNITCPQCANSQEVVIWDTINVTNDPHLREELIDGQINVFECQACDHKAFIDKPLLYHDMDRKFCVQYYPGDLIEEDEFCGQFEETGYPSIGNAPKNVFNELLESEYIFRPHIVFNMDEMVMYIKFREKIINTLS